MDTYHAAYWSSDPPRLSSSDEEEESLYTQGRQNGQNPEVLENRSSGINGGTVGFTNITNWQQPNR